jgi:hypothetical protein
MTFLQSDLPYIKWSLSTLLIVLVVGGSAVFTGQKWADNAHKAKQAAQQQVSDARNKLNAARDDLQNMSTYTKEFSSIQRLGIIGDEQRLNLIEDLDSLRNRKRVLDFKYGISPQQPYKPSPALDSGNFDLKISPMKLQLDLLHEGQFINFVDSLRRDVRGWFILNKCTLEPSSGTLVRLKADCEGGWLTMKNRNGS